MLVWLGVMARMGVLMALKFLVGVPVFVLLATRMLVLMNMLVAMGVRMLMAMHQVAMAMLMGMQMGVLVTMVVVVFVSSHYPLPRQTRGAGRQMPEMWEDRGSAQRDKVKACLEWGSCRETRRPGEGRTILTQCLKNTLNSIPSG
jgi:hypothetical protein